MYIINGIAYAGMKKEERRTKNGIGKGDGWNDSDCEIQEW